MQLERCVFAASVRSLTNYHQSQQSWQNQHKFTVTSHTRISWLGRDINKLPYLCAQAACTCCTPSLLVLRPCSPGARACGCAGACHMVTKGMHNVLLIAAAAAAASGSTGARGGLIRAGKLRDLLRTLCLEVHSVFTLRLLKLGEA